MRIQTAIAPLALSMFLAAPAMAGEITLTGTGSVLAAPDMAMITTGIVTQAETAREALDDNTAVMQELIDVLREAGLTSRDIQTSDFSVSPQYVYSDQRDTRGFAPPPEISGYQVTNTVTITVRELDDLGVILDRAVSVGSNAINGISFSVEEAGALYEEARKRAFTDARAKAETYAEVAGFELGSIEKIDEQTHFAPPPRPMGAMRMEAMADTAVPIEAGELTFEVNVTVTWDIED